MRDSLKAMLRPLGLTYIIDERVLWISNPERIQAEFPIVDEDKAKSRISEVLEQPVGVVFENIHVGSLLEVLSDNYDINVVLDERVVGSSNYSPENYGYYYSPPKPLCDSCTPATDGMIQDLRLKGVLLYEVLDVLSRQLNLTYQVENGSVIFAAPDAFNGEPIPPEFLVSVKKLSAMIKERSQEAERSDESQSAPQPSEDSNRNTGPIKAEDLQLLHVIRTGKRADYKVQISTGKEKMLYGLGESFGPFTLQTIGNDGLCCTILDERTDKTFELCLP